MLITPGTDCGRMTDRETVSVYFNAEEAEALLEYGLDMFDRPRGALIKEAIEVYLGSRDAGKDLLTDHRNEPGDLRRWVYSALIAHEREHASDQVDIERRLAESRDRET